ncbi:MAG: UDP-2,3-diacylglucosamine diphosphatase [Candidatus Marinimicrobia bacterium]|nr:UDP-2,3-diacylglucosamine diphosphatase [Candidatus Neomarinimicrobiota bacterium]
MDTSSYTVSDLQSERLVLPFYFLSDTHISTRADADQKERMEDMLVLLEEILKSKGTLFILGDFFDFWFDKAKHVPLTLKPVVDALRLLRDAGIEIHYLGGNHDYWIEGYLTQDLGIHFYPDALHFDWNGKRIFCHHGDNIVYNNPQYPLIRKIIRAPWAISILKCLPINLTYDLGERVSHYNQNIPEIPRVSELLIGKMHDFLQDKLNEGYDIALSGHVHAPHFETHEGKILAVLGDWIHHRSYGIMDETGFKLIEIK